MLTILADTMRIATFQRPLPPHPEPPRHEREGDRERSWFKLMGIRL